MSADRLHADEVPTDAGLVRRLLGAQFPQWADLPIERFNSSGTTNAIYRLGEDMAVRLPYYKDSHPAFAAWARGWIEQVLAGGGMGGA